MWGLLIRLAIVALMVAKTLKDKSLTKGGVIAAGITGLIHAIGEDDFLYLTLLLGFFVTGTKFTKFKAAYKQTLVSSHSASSSSDVVSSDVSSSPTVFPHKQDHSQHDNDVQTQVPDKEGLRDHVQVLSNSAIASILIVISLLVPRSSTWHDVLRFGVIGHYAAVTADTWSSELGILSKKPPILITTLRSCPRGVNGGVSHFGLGCAVLAGLFIGILSLLFNTTSSAYAYASRFQKLELLVIISSLGLFGSIVDSVLGALFQLSVLDEGGLVVESSSHITVKPSQKVYSGRDLMSNNQVNIAMAGITTVVSMLLYAAK